MYSLLLLDALDMEGSRIPTHQMLKVWKQLILQSFLTLTVGNKCIVAFHKISYGCNKMHQNKLPGTLIFKTVIPGGAPDSSVQKEDLIPQKRLQLSRQNSALATLQFLPATFFSIWKPCWDMRSGINWLHSLKFYILLYLRKNNFCCFALTNC